MSAASSCDPRQGRAVLRHVSAVSIGVAIVGRKSTNKNRTQNNSAKIIHIKVLQTSCDTNQIPVPFKSVSPDLTEGDACSTGGFGSVPTSFQRFGLFGQGTSSLGRVAELFGRSLGGDK